MNDHYKFVNLPLPYAYDALEPYIDTKTMILHHDKHLQTYIDNLNRALENYPSLQSMSLEELIVNPSVIPEAIRTDVHNNAGGVFNHRFYFSNLSPNNPKQPIGLLPEYINWVFGGYDEFRRQFAKAAMSVFGSGYAWLVATPGGFLKIITTPNQDTPLSMDLCPVLNIDVWEHAYYLKHFNVRADYVEDWFQVVNWTNANRNFLSCLYQGRPLPTWTVPSTRSADIWLYDGPADAVHPGI